MKCLLWLILILLLPLTMWSQGSIVRITPEQLSEKIKTSDKYTIVQFWIASCGNAKEVVKNYKNLMKEFKGVVDFYFIAITNKDSLVAEVMDVTGYPYTLYIADPSIENDIYKRKKVFAMELSELLVPGKLDFITLYLDKEDKYRYATDDLIIYPTLLDKSF